MTTPRAHPLETLATLSASAALAGAGGFALSALAGATPLAVAGSAAFLFALGLAVLARIDRGGAAYRLPAWTAAEPLDAGETGPDDEMELLLDDMIAPVADDSRVVRLFAPMPTAGQLKDRIDRHLAGQPAAAGVASTPIATPDASEALHLALAELRRSLR